MEKKSIKVIHVSYAVSKQTASFRIHSELTKSISSKIFVADKSISSDLIIQPKNLLEKLSARVGVVREFLFSRIFRHKKLVYFSYNFGSQFFQNFWVNKLFKINTDILHLHWIGNGFINIDKIRNIDKPIIITLHDVWFLTGGCHVNLGCQKYLNGCFSCPLFSGSKVPFDMTSFLFKKKLKLFKEKKIHVIVLSTWMKKLASASPILSNCALTLIPNGININIFKPHNKSFSRDVFNLNQNSKILLFGGISANSDFNKGYDLLCESLRFLKMNKEIELVIFGNSDKNIDYIEGFKVTHIGYLNDDETLALLYSTADVVLVPSRQESFSQVTLESISCGTPVIAYNYSGPSDIIQHKFNGYLAEPYDTIDFANGINWAIIESANNSKISENARNFAVDNFSLSVIAQKHIELYQSLLSSEN